MYVYTKVCTYAYCTCSCNSKMFPSQVKTAPKRHEECAIQDVVAYSHMYVWHAYVSYTSIHWTLHEGTSVSLLTCACTCTKKHNRVKIKTQKHTQRLELTFRGPGWRQYCRSFARPRCASQRRATGEFPRESTIRCWSVRRRR